MRIRTLAAAAAIPLALLAIGCGDDNDDDDGGATSGTSDADSGDHNNADVEFAQMMIPHHRQAVDMAALAADAAEDPTIVDLAGRIKEAQQPEIDEMTSWLQDWEEEVPSTNGDDMDMGGDTDSGMMSDGDMDALEAAQGPVFDRLFAELMIEHHQGAIAMAEDEIDAGQNSDAIVLAEAVVATQQAEISELQAFLDGTG